MYVKVDNMEYFLIVIKTNSLVHHLAIAKYPNVMKHGSREYLMCCYIVKSSFMKYESDKGTN